MNDKRFLFHPLYWLGALLLAVFVGISLLANVAQAESDRMNAPQETVFCTTPSPLGGSNPSDCTPTPTATATTSPSPTNTPLSTAQPHLSIASNIAAYKSSPVVVPVSFNGGGANITSIAFSIDFDQSCLAFDSTDSDADGNPDAIKFNLPVHQDTGKPIFYPSASFNPQKANGELTIIIADYQPPLAVIPDSSNVVEITFTTCAPAGSIQVAPVLFATSPSASFGNTNGVSVAGTTSNGSVLVHDQAAPITPVISYSGFNPDPYGWNIVNASVNPTWDDFKATFGPAAVEWKQNGKTTHYPKAQKRYDDYYSKLGKGVCYGMVTTAAHRFTNSIPLPDGIAAQNLYGVSTPKVVDKKWLPSKVTDYVYQYQGMQDGAKQLESWNVGVQYPLTESVRLIKESIDGKLTKPYGLSMYGKDVNGTDKCTGHIVLPDAYSQRGDVVTFSIYDPNYPGQNGSVTVNATAGTWQFTPDPTWQWGSQFTCKDDNSQDIQDFLFARTLEYDTTTAIPSWSNDSEVIAANMYTTVMSQLVVSGSLTVTVNGGSPVQYIPTGMIPGQAADYPTLYLLDSSVPVSVTLHQAQDGQSSVTLFGSNAVVAIEGQAIKGTTDAVTFNADASATTVMASEATTRSVTVITGDRTQQHQTDLSEITLNKGAQAQFMVGTTGSITISVGTDQSSYKAHFLQAGVGGSSEFTLTVPSLVAGGTQVLQPDFNQQSALVQSDDNSDGKIDHQEVIDNKKEQNTSVYLPLINR